MKTKQRHKYEAPKVEVIVVELEEAIANTSPGAEVPGNPEVNGFSTGSSSNGWSSQNEAGNGF